MREPSPDVEAPHVFGALHLVKRRTGEAVSHIPLDTERVTLGRDRDCDVRLYFEEVSKLHAEIVFDRDSGMATLQVHGGNGVYYTPAGEKGKLYVPPSVIVLHEGDKFSIRKKMFCFSYGGAPASSYHSPAPTPAKARRLSHRMSIVPPGKKFAPSPAKSRFATPARAMPHPESVEEEAEELVFDELVGLNDGEEGDKVYLEKREDEDRPRNPFMTPQPKGRAPLRNTSAVPRTRTLTFALPERSEPAHDEVSPESSDNEYISEDEPALLDEGVDDERDIPAPATPTPAPIPLPEICPMGGPRRPLVSPRAAYVTPRAAGSDSLRRTLLIRSACKHWEAEPASETINHVEVRRRRSSGRATLSPPKPDSSSDEDEDKENAPALQWVYEDGQGGLDDSDSDQSLDAEYSIPGARVLDFHASGDPGSPSESGSGSDGDGEADMSEDESGEYDERGYDEVYEDGVGVLRYESDEEPAGEDGVADPVAEEAGDISSDIDDEVDRSLVCPPDEVDRSPSPVSARFYTPQSKPSAYASARLSLAGIGPARFEPDAPTDRLPTGMRIPPSPGRLGKPVRMSLPARLPAAEPQLAAEEEEEEEQKPTTPPPATPPRQPPQTPRGLTPAQRAQLATPIALPAAPRESFRDAVPAAVATPRRSSFLDALRSARKNTVSFADPETPARAAPREGRHPRMPTPRVDRILEVDSAPSTPTAVEELARVLVPELGEDAKTPNFKGMREMFVQRPEPPTPAMGGMREMFAQRAEPCTPALNGVREMFAHRPEPPTPAMGGIRALFAQPVEPPTPRMDLGDMFPSAEPEVPETDPAPEDEPEPEAEPENEPIEAKPKPSRVPTRATRTLPREPETKSAPTRRRAAAEPVPEAETASAPSRTRRAPPKPTAPAKAPPATAAVTRAARSVSASKAPSKPTTNPKPAATKAIPPRSTRTTRATASASPPPDAERSPSPDRARSAPTRSTRTTRRVTRSQTAELEDGAGAAEDEAAGEVEEQPEPAAERETRSAPVRRSRRVLGEAEPDKEEPAPALAPAPKAARTKAASAAPKAKQAAKTAAKAAPAKRPSTTRKTTARVTASAPARAGTGTADKENSATPPRAAERKMPVRVTRSRKA